MSAGTRPRVGVTMGDPAGIGPEIALKAAADPRVCEVCEPVLYGPRTAAERARFTPGVLAAEAGLAAYEAVEQAVADALAGRLDAMSTAPLNKEALSLAGFPLLSGFWSKDMILSTAYDGGHWVTFVVGVVTAALTAFYMFRLIYMTFYGESRVVPEATHHLHESPALMTTPLVILAALA
ncbi:MAG: 4-hydroxythreonine-4-phosphate dehydrogenase PdxA, partial [Vicinamibacterales bacterium]|nr:4-hydroxythreonine-4-phosphate dehydrogenase PdxA [Vicinamibacterales bacterium]